MFKDYTKYLATSLEVYLFVLIIIFIMKLVGLNYFGLDNTNEMVLMINSFARKYNLIDIWYVITMYIYGSMFIQIACNDNSPRMKKYILLCVPIFFLVSYLKMKFPNMGIFFIIDVFYLYILSFIYLKITKQSTKKSFSRHMKVIILNTMYQVISLCVRNNKVTYDYNDFVTIFILNFDYLILVLITLKLYFKKGGIDLCLVVEDHSLSSLKKINLKKLLTKLQENFRNFKKLDKETKLTYIIYFILSFIWNVLSVVIILVVAQLNHTLIECLFILTSFWLSKTTFGKPFHLSSMSQCFVVSNLTYYTLNRVTTPVGISIIVPILLGVGLSYVTSKFVKKLYKPLYKGMPQETFEETILKVIDKDSDKYKICYDYFIKKKSALYLSGKYNYTEAGIRKIKDRINKKIKELE